jgi:WD40 repeat protein
MDRVTSVQFSPDGARIVSGSHDRTIRVWNAHDGTLVAGPFEGHTDRVTSVQFSPDGTRIVSSSHDYTIRVWDTQAVNHINTILDTPWTIRNDGWFLNRHLNLLFWVPAEIRYHFPRLNNIFTIGPQGALHVGYHNMLLGEDWSKCYCYIDN